MAKTCTTVQELMDHLKTLPPSTPLNEDQTCVVLRNVSTFTPISEEESGPELFFETPDKD